MPPERLIERGFRGRLVGRADVQASERIIEGVVVPFGAIAEVQDSPGGPRYRESIARSAVDGLAAGDVLLDYLTEPPRSYNTHEGSRLAGRGIASEPGEGGLWMQFRVARTAAGDELLGLTDASEGPPVLADLSVQFRPIAERRRSDGVVERTAIDIRRVTVVPTGAYSGATITAVRAASEGDMPQINGAAPAADDDETATPETPETETEGTGPRGAHRTRVTVDVDRAAEDRARAGAEREAVAELSRSGPGRGLPGVVISRAEAVYGPQSEHSFLRDGWLATRGDSEASERYQRHARHVADVAVAMERATSWGAGGELMSRAGDVLSTEIPGAYPNDYLPGLLTPRILKGRPMGDFYNRFPIADARPRIFPKVTTSTTVAVQSAEGAALTATDFATTAVTATPLIYGAYTDVSRQTLDGADPAAQSMILQDLVEAYAQASEAVIKTAVEAGSSASGTAITAATPYAGTLANVVTYYGTRFRPAEAAFIPSALFSVLLAQGDTTGRPFLPMLGQMNSDGSVQRGGVQADVLGAATKLSWASTANVCVFGVPSDFVIYESSIAQFSYDQIVGPQAVRIGIWAYLVVGARLGSLKVTAA
jgi:phage head maturation protease